MPMDITTVDDTLAVKEGFSDLKEVVVLDTMRARLKAIKAADPTTPSIDYALGNLSFDLVESLDTLGLVDEFGDYPKPREEGGESNMNEMLLGLRALAPYLEDGTHFTFVRESGFGTVTWQVSGGDVVAYEGVAKAWVK